MTGTISAAKQATRQPGLFKKKAPVKKKSRVGKKGEFEVFPGALVGGEKEADDLVVPAPFVKKVGQGPRQGNEQKPCQTKEKDLFVHASNKCGRKGMYS